MFHCGVRFAPKISGVRSTPPLLTGFLGPTLWDYDSPKFGSVKFLFRFKDDGDVTVKNGGFGEKTWF